MFADRRNVGSHSAALVPLAALLLVALLASSSWAQASTEDVSDAGSSTAGQRLSLNLQNVTLGNVLKVMTQKSGINFLIGADLVGRTINVYLEDVLVEDALGAILRANGLWYTRHKNTNIYVIMELPEGPPIATLTEVIQANYSNAADLQPTLESIMTEAGSIVVDSRTNSLVVSDIPENMETLRQLARDLDEPTGQVLIEAKIVEFAEDAASELGITWDVTTYEGGSDGNGSGAATYGSTFNTDDEEGLFEFTFGKFASFTKLKDLTAKISALQRDGFAEVLAKPQILTLDNKEALIEITRHMALAKKVTYREGGDSTVEPIFGDVGVTLKVTPHVNNDQFVTMMLEPKVSSAQRSTYFPDEAVDTKQRTARTTVMVKDGQTVVIGGLLRKDIIRTDFKVPILGDIPLLGELFKKSIDSESETEIMLFLTPRILGAESLQRMSERLESEVDQRLGEN